MRQVSLFHALAQSMFDGIRTKAYARASGPSKSSVQNQNMEVGSLCSGISRGGTMPGSEGRFPRSLIEFQGRFATEAGCAKYLFERRWPEGFVCPGCGGGRAWALKTKPFTYQCANCGRQTSVTAGTIMHASKLPLTTWFWAAVLMATHSNGISALQLQSQLGLGSYRTAWMLCAKLRRAMVNPEREPLSGLVEADETIIPFRTKNDPVVMPAGRSGI